jgi:hypothetical protein
MGHRTASIAIAVASVACGAAVPPVPGKGGPAWLELTTEHFVVWTDAGEPRGRELVQDIERLRQVVVGTAFPHASAMSKSFVIALRDDAETDAFVPGDFAALASPPNGNLLAQPVIVLSASSNVESADRIAAHELVHAISHAVIPVQPRWFAEGMAKFYETVDLSDDAADLGRAPDYRGQPLVIHHFEPVRQMLACRTLACSDIAFYATAWALYTFLANAQPDRLARYQAALVETRDGDQAWQQAFGDTTPNQIDQDMRQWLTTGKHQVLHFKVAFQTAAIAMRPLHDADVYAARAFMRYEFLGDREHARADLAAAEALQPAHPIVRALKTAVCVPACRP